jgi:hypothetical protein
MFYNRKVAEAEAESLKPPIRVKHPAAAAAHGSSSSASGGSSSSGPDGSSGTAGAT